MRRNLSISIFSVFSVLLALLLLAAGCGSSEQNGQPAGGSSAGESTQNRNENAQDQNGNAQNLLEKIKAEGKIRIGTEGTYPPFTFHDSSGKLTGFDVELATEVAKRLGVEPEFVETQWDAMFAGLDAGRFDMIANQVSIRRDRQEKYDFSKPYNVSSAVLVVHRDNQTKISRISRG